MPEPLLTLEGVNAHYGTAHVLFGVDLEVIAGTVLALLGRNGAGKSTTAKAIMGVDVRSSGRITFAGRDLAGSSTTQRARRGLQLVPEDRRIYADLTVRENLMLGRHAAGDRQPMTVTEVVKTFPMVGGLLDRRGHALSGGEQQIVAVARALVARPLLLIMDEPSEGLAPIIVKQVGDAIRSLRAHHDTTILLIEQNSTFALALGDTVAVIDEGVVTARGTPAEITADPDLQRRLLSV